MDNMTHTRNNHFSKMKNTQDYELYELTNGIRVIHKEVNYSKIAHIAIMLDMGSRDEQEEEQGLAHFLEHMSFKGTKKRKTYHIINRLESIGGELNAYTTKEKICFYASLLDIHIEKAVEILSDIVFHSVFPNNQIEKERKVILEEMSMYQDSPDDAIQDEFDKQLFPNHPLGKNILGIEKTVKSFQKQHFVGFLNRMLNTEKIILSSLGNYPTKKIIRLVEKYLKEIVHKNNTPQRSYIDKYKPTHKIVMKSISQTHTMMGLPSISIKNKNRIPFLFLTNILGGNGTKARLNMCLREKYGWVYEVESSYIPYFDTGQFSIYFATTQTNLEKCKAMIIKEIKRLQNKPLGQIQLHQAKNQLKGQLALSEENNNAVMLMMAKSILDLNTVTNLQDIFNQIDNMTPFTIMKLAKEHWQVENMSTLSYLPKH